MDTGSFEKDEKKGGGGTMRLRALQDGELPWPLARVAVEADVAELHAAIDSARRAVAEAEAALLAARLAAGPRAGGAARGGGLGWG